RRRMKIGIDLGRVTLGPAGGIAPLLSGVWNAVFKLYPEHTYFVFATAENRSLLATGSPGIQLVLLPPELLGSDLDRVTATDRQARRLKLDVLFRSYPVFARWNFPLSKQVFLIPDIQHEYYPEFFSAEALRARRLAFTQALSASGAIATISNFSRQT